MADSVTVSVTVDGQRAVVPTPGMPGTTTPGPGSSSPGPALDPRPGLPVTGLATILLLVVAVGFVVAGIALVRTTHSSDRRSSHA